MMTLQKIQKLVSYLDIIISKQLAEILHHQSLQTLEASWRSLFELMSLVKHDNRVIIKMLAISRQEMQQDLLAVIEFDQSQLFHKIYSNEIGMPGGLPYNVVITDFYFSHSRRDVEILHSLSQIGAAAFAPVITAPTAQIFGVEKFSQLAKIKDVKQIFQQQEYNAWQQLRQQEDSKFLGLVMPKRLVRLPYSYPSPKPMPFVFIDPQPARGYLWANAAYAFATVLVKCFQQTGWLADIRGVHHDGSADGYVEPPVDAYYATDKKSLFAKPQIECVLGDEQERQLKQLGIMSLAQIHYHKAAAFYHATSLQKPKAYIKASATINSETASYLQYMFCACRFAHYLKILGRDKVGSGFTAMECEAWLNKWLLQFIAVNSDLSSTQRSHYPLQDARVSVKDMPGKPGSYRCIIHLKPHFQLEQLQSNLVLVTELQQ